MIKYAFYQSFKNIQYLEKKNPTKYTESSRILFRENKTKPYINGSPAYVQGLKVSLS